MNCPHCQTIADAPRAPTGPRKWLLIRETIVAQADAVLDTFDQLAELVLA